MTQQIENYKVFLIQIGVGMCIANVRLETTSNRRVLKLYFMPYVNKHKRIRKKIIEILNNYDSHYFTISSNPLIVDEILLKSGGIDIAIMKLCRERAGLKFIKTVYVWK